MGTYSNDTSFPRDSSIYWYGSGISTTRILEGHNKINTRKGGPKVNFLLITKRERWVAFLQKKMEHIRASVFSESDKQKIRAAKNTQEEVRERIAAIITTPKKSWTKRKKQEKCSIPRNFFGQYA